MSEQGFEGNKSMNETLNVESMAAEPLKPKEQRVKRVDINVLKSKLQAHENKEFRKNMFVFISFVAGLGVLGIYLSI